MSKNEDPENTSNTEEEDLHDVELNQANFLALRKQLSKVTKENQELIQEVDQLKTAIEWLKRTIGNHTNALAGSATALPGQEARTGTKITVPKPMQLGVAKLPKVLESESVSEITSFSPSCCNKTLSFSYGPGQPDRKLLKMATIYTEAENKSCVDKCDYFIHICVVNDDRPTRSIDQFWLQIFPSSTIVNISTVGGSGSSALRKEKNAIDIRCSVVDFVTKKDATLDITVSMSLFLYDSITTDNSTSTPSASRETRTAKLLDFKSQMRPTVNVNEIQKGGGVQRVGIQVGNAVQPPPNPLNVAERTLLDSGSPIFIADFKSARPLYRAGIYCSLTQKSIDAFSNWVYGIDTRAFVDDIQLNMEVLHFAREFWICDLIKFCIDNICRILEKNFTLELLVKVWQFEERHKIRNLDECLREVIKRKAKMNFDIEGCLPWRE